LPTAAKNAFRRSILIFCLNYIQELAQEKSGPLRERLIIGKIYTKYVFYLDKRLHSGYTTERTVDKRAQTKMSGQDSTTTSRDRVLDTAEQLFNDRGYSAVSMRDIADSLAMRQASLYYHVPQGKEQLYMEVALRGLDRHEKGVAEAIASTAGSGLEARLLAVGGWFMHNAPLRLLSMLETDMSALSPEHAAYLTSQANQKLFVPLTALFAEAQDKDEIRDIDPAQLAGYFLSLMDGISYSSTSGIVNEATDVLIRDALDVLLNGLWRQANDRKVD
jgi:AcrR family transcriptional regulator